MYFRSPLTKIFAEKARNSLATGLYAGMFGQMMQIINSHLLSSSENYSIGILDIAGFGKLKRFYSTYIPTIHKLILKSLFQNT